MAYTLTQAGKLLNAGELELFAASRTDAVQTLSAARLRGKVKRARSLRDKYQDLLKRQKLATRARTGTKAGTSGVANQRTKQKAEMLAEVLQRFEKRLAQIEAAEARAAKAKAAAQARLTLSRKRSADAAQAAARRPKTSPKAPAAKTAEPVSKKLQPTPERARAARHAMQFKVAGRQAIQAHVGARGRRSQAKRDNRK